MYFLDTYAIIEILEGNENYKNYVFDKKQVMFTIFNLMEAHFYFLKNYGKAKANGVYDELKSLVVSVDDSIIKDANDFKLRNLRARMSFTDCIGYVSALKLNAKFVTGDYAFKNFDNVEFVK